MNVNAMRLVDRFAGIPLCWATGLRHRFLPPSPIASDDSPLVVMKFFGLGSVLLSTPLLEALRRIYPARQIIYVTFTFNGELLERLPQPALRLTIDPSSPARFLRDALRTLIVIRRSRPAMVFDLEFFSKFSTLLAALSGASVRVGFQLPTRWRRWNLTHPAPLNHAAHVTQIFLRQLEAVGPAFPETPPVSPLGSTPTERSLLDQILPPSPADTEWIAVNINAGRTSIERRWAPERFLDVVRRLAAASGQRRFAFVGTADERAYVAAALAQAPDLAEHVVNCAGRLSLGGFIALLERSALLLTNDSGPMHVAGAVGTPIVALFGPESPALYGPQGIAHVLYKSLSCSPCLTVYNAKQFVCPFDARCMQEITVEEVTAAADTILVPSRSGVT